MGVFALVFFAATHAFADASLESAQLLQYFSAGCASQGQWTVTAQTYASELVNTLTTLVNDNDCKTLNGALTQVQTLAAAASSINQDANLSQYLSLKAQQKQLLIMIASTTDPTQLSNFANQLQQIDLSLAEYQSLSASDQRYTKIQQSGKALGDLVSGTTLLLQQAAQNETCIEHNHSLLTGIAGLAGSVQAVLMTGGSSLIAAAGVDIFNAAIQSAHVHRLDKRINEMASAVTASAYQCVLETLSNQWCAADDALKIIDLQAQAITTPDHPTPIQNGIEILDRDLGIFLSWLNAVRSGTDPDNQATASQQATVLGRDEAVRVARANGLGLISQNKVIFDKLQDSNSQWNLEIQTITNLVTQFTSTSCFNCPLPPLGDVFASDPTNIPSWYLIGVPDAKIPRDPNTGLRKPLNSYSLASILAITGPDFKPDLSFVRKNMLQWIDLARARVNTELSIYLNLDPLKLVIDAATPDLNGLSPYSSLIKAIAFLKNGTVDTAAAGSFQGLYRDTLRRLQTIACDIQNVAVSAVPAATNSEPACKDIPAITDPAQAVADIYAEAVLDNGSAFLQTRLQWAIELALNHLVVTGSSGLPDPQAAALLAGNDIVAQLESVPTATSLNATARDVKNSQGIIQNTMQAFGKEFGKGIARALNDYQLQAAQVGEKLDGANNEATAELCLKMLAMPKWPEGVSESICYNRSLPSVFPKGPSSVVITKDLIHADYSKRVCAYRDYNRFNFIYQNFQGRKPPLKR